MSFPLTMTTPTWDTSGQWGGSACLDGGTGAPASSPQASNSTGNTISMRLKHNTANLKVAMGDTISFWLGSDGAGGCQGQYGSVSLSNHSVVMNDNAWHNLVLDFGPWGGNLWLDGVNVATSSTDAASAGVMTAANLEIGNYGGNGGFAWDGEIDEVAMFSGQKYTTTFTPPTSPFTGSESNLLALWHLDSNGTDSAGASSPATKGTLTGPTSGTVGSASSDFTVTLDGTITTVTFTPSDSSGGGSFSPTSLTLSTGTPSGDFTYTPGSAGTKSISVTNDQSLSNDGSPISFVASTGPVSIAVNNSDIFWTPDNWQFSGSTWARSVWMGAYGRAKVHGATTFSINTNNGTNAQFLFWSVNGGSITYQAVATGAQSYGPTGLSDGDEIWFGMSDEGHTDRWVTPTDFMKITGFTLDSGGSLGSPTLKPKRACVFGDSITTGLNQVGSSGATQWPTTWNSLLAGASDLNCEISVMACDASGYEDSGTGGIPDFMTCWDEQVSGVSRTLFSGYDYVLINHGVNGTTTQSDVQTMLTNLRGACPSASILQIVPFGQANVTPITAAVAAQGDANAFLIDLGSSGAAIVTANNNGDGIHPNTTASPLLAAALMTKIAAALPSAATKGTLTGPTSGHLGSASTNFTVTLDGTNAGVDFTPSDGGDGGTFSPTSVTLSTATQSATFTYTPASVGTKSISITNDGALTDAGSPISYAVSLPAATAGVLSGPSSGPLTQSSNFTIELNGTNSGTTFTPNDNSAGGTFSPTTLALSTGTNFGTFKYTPPSNTPGTYSVRMTNNGSLTNSGSPHSYVASASAARGKQAVAGDGFKQAVSGQAHAGSFPR